MIGYKKACQAAKVLTRLDPLYQMSDAMSMYIGT